jgi:2-succinyl-5-enolpyruvyl-6-hydroxy-3-cyclohexene-1-carboxylate synthase
MPIRQLDTWSGNRLSPLGLFGNRGVSGIDGQVSTLAGLNHGGVPTWALLGDLSLCHDLSGLLQARRLKRPILVINNGGGRIFDYLPQHGLPDFQALWRTPVDIDLGQLAASVGLEHARVDTATALDRVLSKAMQSADLPVLIEVLIDGDRSRETHQRFWMRVAQASSLGETA